MMKNNKIMRCEKMLLVSYLSVAFFKDWLIYMYWIVWFVLIYMAWIF